MIMSVLRSWSCDYEIVTIEEFNIDVVVRTFTTDILDIQRIVYWN